MFVRGILSSDGAYCVGEYGIDRIVLFDGGKYADCYTVGGNIFTVKVRKVLDDRKVVTNSRKYHQNLY